MSGVGESDSIELLWNRLPERMRNRLKHHLNENERLLWFAQPNERRMARRALPGLIIKNIFPLFVGSGFLSAGLLWEFVNPNVPASKWIWWIAWTAYVVSAISIFSRYYIIYHRAMRTIYAITDQRALEYCATFISRVQSFQWSEIEFGSVHSWTDGSGEIRLEPRLIHRKRRLNDYGNIRFEFLNNVKIASEIIEQFLGRELPHEKPVHRIRNHTIELAIPEADHLARPLKEQLNVEMNSDEKVLWVGIPTAHRMALRTAFPSGCLFLIVFVCTGVTYFVASIVTSIIPEGSFKRWVQGIPWLFGLLLPVLGGFTILAIGAGCYAARRTAYLITNQRAVIVKVGMGGRIISFGKTALDRVQVRQLDNGGGEIIFEEKICQSIADSDSTEHRSDVIGFFELKQIEPARIALEQLLGYQLNVQHLNALSLNQDHKC
ncbi:MAG: hypothetical protein R3B84_00750 [Zavarzinella sp.]